MNPPKENESDPCINFGLCQNMFMFSLCGLCQQILYSTSLEFAAAIDQALDLDQILAAHKSYLAKISERCLLHHKVSFVREAVSKVLNLAITFQRRWDAGVHTFR